MTSDNQRYSQDIEKIEFIKLRQISDLEFLEHELVGADWSTSSVFSTLWRLYSFMHESLWAQYTSWFLTAAAYSALNEQEGVYLGMSENK